MKDYVTEIVLGLVALACVLGIVVLDADNTTALELSLTACIGALGGTALPKPTSRR